MADGLTWSTYVTSLANLMVVPVDNPEFLVDLPNIRDYAELRIQRDLDLIDSSIRDDTATLTAGNRNFTFPSSNGTFVVTDEINVITPASATTADGGTRNALVPASEEMLNMLWPGVTGSTVPQYFAMVNQGLVVVGPWPDAAYRVEVVGTIRLPSLSSTNVTTVISWYFPDLFLAASMVRAAGFQKNYGSAVDDPKQAVTWDSEYKTLLASADVEENRKKFTAGGWSSKEPSPQATPPRT